MRANLAVIAVLVLAAVFAASARAATFNVGAGDVPGLVSAINAANANGQSNTIVLADSRYTLTAVDNYWYGPNGLPPIASTMTIEGNGATIARDPGAPNFRLLFVGADPADPNTLGYTSPGPGMLTLHNLTLTGGIAKGGSAGASGAGGGMGGAIFSQGLVTLDAVTVTANIAQGGSATYSGGVNAIPPGGGGIGTAGATEAGGGFGPGSFGGAAGGQGAPMNPDGSAQGGGGGGGFASSEPGGNGGGPNGTSTLGGNGGGPDTGLGGNAAAAGSTGGFAGDGSGGAGGGGRGSAVDGGAFGEGGQYESGGGVGGGGGWSNSSGGGFGGGGGFCAGGGFGGGGGMGEQTGCAPGTPGFGGGTAAAAPPNGTYVDGGGGAGMGGAIFNMQGELTVTNVTMYANSAIGGPGGAGGSGLGGAIFNLNGAVTLTNATVDGNTAAQGGGAVYNLGYDSATQRTASLTAVDSILYGSAGGVSDLVSEQPTDTTAGANKSSSAVTATAPDIVGTSAGAITGSPLTPDPSLGAIQDNGGPGMQTELPASGSPALGAGAACPPTDERGFPRPSSGCDLGAGEVTPQGPPAATITTPADGATYPDGEVVDASYACSDPRGRGIASCTGSVPNGSQIDTSSPGQHTFNVTATSEDAKTAVAQVTYTVAAPPVAAPPVAAPPSATVAAPPTATITSPANGANYTRGQVVKARDSCQEGTGGPGISSCAGTVAVGHPIDTATLGRHTFAVTATSVDGQSITSTVTYTVVLPANHFKVSHIKAQRDGTITLTIAVPGPGKIDVLETAWNDNLAHVAVLLEPAKRRLVYARGHAHTVAAGTIRLRVKPNARGYQLLHHHTYRVVLRLWVSYTPTGGAHRSLGFYGLHVTNEDRKAQGATVREVTRLRP